MELNARTSFVSYNKQNQHLDEDDCGWCGHSPFKTCFRKLILRITLFGIMEGSQPVMFCRISHLCQMLQELELWKITLSFLLLTRALYPFLFSSDLAMALWSSNATAVHLLTSEIPEYLLLHMCSFCLSHCCMKSLRGWPRAFLLKATRRIDPSI